MNAGEDKTCQGCAGPITPDQIVNRQAGLVAGALLCPACVARKRQELVDARNAAMRAQQPSVATAAPVARPPSAAPVAAPGEDVGHVTGGVWLPAVHDGEKDIADESLSLISDVEHGDVQGSTKIRSFAQGSTLAGEHKEEGYNRPLAAHNEPATRVRTFHGKLTEAGLAHMDETINEWIDAHPDVFVKSSNSTIGVFEAKTKEPHIFITLFY